MPLPAHLTRESGQLSIDGGFRVVFEGYTEPRLERAVERFRTNLARKTGTLYLPRVVARAARIHYPHDRAQRSGATVGRRQVLST